VSQSLRSAAGTLLAIVAATGWVWSVALLSTREHLTTFYTVLSAAPPLWGLFALGDLGLLASALAGIVLCALCHDNARKSGGVFPPATRWLLLSWAVPLVDLLRLAGWPIRFTFLEPILVAGVTGAAAGHLARGWNTSWAERPDPTQGGNRGGRLIRSPKLWPVAVWILAVTCAAWWYCQAQQAYDNYLLGFNDFGHFAWRVASTWEGRGLLMETQGLPAFWDHFNPGLALLAPLWGLWPDARLFFVVQAICLALPALLVYDIGRRLGGSPGAAAAWAAAYLLYPALGQLNVNCTYGWHPISLALPLVFAAISAVLRGQRIAAGAACVLACSFQEDVPVVLACACLVMSLEAWRHRQSEPATRSGAALLACRMPWWGWLAACVVFAAGFVAIFELAPFSRYQVHRFSRLGSSPGEVVLSPVLRPGVFWGTVMRPEAACFLLALWVPLGLKALRRGWVVLAATLLPLVVLIAWGHPPATSIAFQYTTVLITLFFLAAMAGAATVSSSAPDRVQTRVTQKPSGSLRSAGIGALAACAVASSWFGGMPWTQATLTDVIAQTYRNDAVINVLADRKVNTPGNAALNRIVERIAGEESSVLATGRIASHLLRVRRLDTVGQAGERWKQFEAEIGPGRSPIELFDLLIVDTGETFYQSRQQIEFILREARRAGYKVTAREHGVLVCGRAK